MLHQYFKFLKGKISAAYFARKWKFFYVWNCITNVKTITTGLIVHPWSFLPQDAEKSPVFSTLVEDVFGYLVVFRARGQKLAKVMATLHTSFSNIDRHWPQFFKGFIPNYAIFIPKLYSIRSWWVSDFELKLNLQIFCYK